MCIVFVILHYLTLQDTLEAVASIRLFEPSAKVVVVDNASNNGSLEKLEAKFVNDPDISIVAADENLGFARGNNLGIAVAFEQYSPSFICLMNNDVQLIGKISHCIEQEFAKSKFAVLGPMIYTADGRCCDNPGRNEPIGLDEVKKIIRENQKYTLLNRWHLWKPYNLFNFLFHRSTVDLAQFSQHKKFLEPAENVQLHGSFLVLSKEYFKVFTGLYDKTFLYMEEEILFYQVRKAGLKTVYLPEIKVFHKEDSSSRALWSDVKKRSEKKNEYILNSAKHLQNLMEGKNEASGN